ncbi:MAG: sec-independent protein translocase protein TatC [Saprospiraceae bacterium]|jgi:sec-independent protein translocase protein TatC
MGDAVFQNIIFGPKEEWFLSYQAICNLSNAVGLGDNLCFSPPSFEVQATQFAEAFITHIKVAFIGGFVIAFPYVFYQIWSFIKPGLYEKEQKAARGTVFICSVLFSLGVLFGYFIISPFAINFLAGYEIPGVVNNPTLSSYVSYMVMFTVPAGIAFELPVVMYFLAKVGLVTADFLRSYRKHSVVVILVLAAIITPPDVVTQCLIGIPLYFLYEASIIIVSRVEKKAALEEAEAA